MCLSGVKMNEELKSCLFCYEATDLILSDESSCFGHKRWYFISCETCMARGPREDSAKEAIEAWGKRA